jgi:tetrapyrrole methylase family protein/MazG family protein/ATP diphosphatase
MAGSSRAFPLPPRLPVPQQQGQTLPRLVELMQRLLAPGGCPWDREQTPASLRRYVLEEACEVIDAIDSGDAAGLQEELGDLLLQVVFLAELARSEHGFGPDDVVFGICEKLVRRHPHVFEEVQLEDAGAVARQWEVLKAQEKPKRRELLARVPRSLPGLERAQRIGKEVRRVGFDWPDASGSRAELQEELAELDAAVEGGDASEIEAELGDLLFAAVNLARHHGVDAARALQRTNDKFCRRFAHVERRVQQELGDWPRDAEGQPTTGVSLEQLDGYWNEAKASTEPGAT